MLPDFAVGVVLQPVVQVPVHMFHNQDSVVLTMLLL